MHGKTLKQLLSMKDELNSILESRSDKLLDSTNSAELQEELQRNVIDYISETIEQIDITIENIENGEYDQNSDDEFDDY
jgi:RNA polymerase-binding transcription factor DksA